MAPPEGDCSRPSPSVGWIMTSLGCGLFVITIVLMRNPELAPAFLTGVPGIPIRWHASAWPATTPAALLIAIIGVVLVSVGNRVRLAREDIGESSSAFGVSRAALWFGGAAVVTLLLADIELTRHHLGGWLPVLFWAGALAMGAVLLSVADRRNGVDLRPGLCSRELLLLVMCAAFGFAFWLHDISSWKYALIGDEYRFLWDAESTSTRSVPSIISGNLLEASGVYHDNPLMVTAVQALVFKALGVSVVTWKATGAVFMMVGLPFLYLHVRDTWNGIAAWAACGMFICFPLVAVHSKIGYPNGAMLTPILVTIGIHTLAARGSNLFIFLAGVAAGAGAFLLVVGWAVATTYLAVVLWCELIAPVNRRAALQRAVLAAAGWLLACAPILVQTDYLRHLFEKNMAGKITIGHGFDLFAKGLLAPLHYRPMSHYVSSEVVDTVSALLILVGVAAVIGARKWSPLLLLVLCILFSASLAQYRSPSVTRFHVMAVPWSVLGGAGAGLVLSSLTRPLLRAASVFALIGIVLLLNLHGWRNVDAWFVSEAQFVIHHYQTTPKSEPGVHVVRKWDNIEVLEDGAYRMARVPVTALHDFDSASGLRGVSDRQPDRPIRVFLSPYAALPAETADLIIKRRLPAVLIGKGTFSDIDLDPPLLTADQIRALIAPRVPVGTVPG